MDFLEKHWFRIGLLVLLAVAIGLVAFFMISERADARQAALEAAEHERIAKEEIANKKDKEEALKSVNIAATTACIMKAQDTFTFNSEFTCKQQGGTSDGCDFEFQTSYDYAKYMNTLFPTSQYAKLYVAYERDIEKCKD